MMEKTIDKLPEVLKMHICTLKDASYDGSNKDYMCESSIKVVNFDKIPGEYCRGKGWHCVPTSNDALYITANDEGYFIEFKNGEVCRHKLYRKIYDSLIVLIELGLIPNLDFARNNINYILVYNSEKHDKVHSSQERDKNYTYILKRANKKKTLFGISNFKQYLFKNVHTYSKEDFQDEFVLPMERAEGIC